MKLGIYALLLTFIFMGCEKKENIKTYTPRVLTVNESFNDFSDASKGQLTIYSYSSTEQSSGDNEELKMWYGVKLGDTIVRIQRDLTDKNAVSSQFGTAEYVNSQKTTILVQLADSSGFVPPCYLISLKKGKLEVVSLYRASNSQQDRRFAKGVNKIGRSGYLINNDFFVTTVDAKVFLIKRQHPSEMIHGIHFINSPDKKTLVFLVSDSLYEVHYPTGEVFTQPLSSKAPKVAQYMFKYVQDNYSWQKNEKGIYFLKANPDDNRIIDGGNLG